VAFTSERARTAALASVVSRREKGTLTAVPYIHRRAEREHLAERLGVSVRELNDALRDTGRMRGAA
jgi:hypothetical protein